MKDFQYYLERVNNIINEETMSGKDALLKLKEIVEKEYDSIGQHNRKEIFSDPTVLELIIESIAKDAETALEFARKYLGGQGWAVSAEYFQPEDVNLTVGVALNSIASNAKTAFEYMGFIPMGWHKHLKKSSVYKDFPEIPEIALDSIKNNDEYKKKYEKMFPDFEF
jgi:hypothetical protein